jgi:hypothetical protein|tara:strand:+ start:1948 stop:2217 length:270 start_codon:yes stop_codon:yes gene_type:complete
MSKLTKLTIILIISATFSMLLPWFCPEALGKQPKSKFYDFNEQLIDGELKRPSTLFTDARDKVKFDRLLKLKKSFLPKLFDTAKEKVFK